MKQLVFILAFFILCSFGEDRYSGRIHDFEQRIDSIKPIIKDLTGFPACVYLFDNMQAALVVDTSFTKAFRLRSDKKGYIKESIVGERLDMLKNSYLKASQYIYNGPPISPLISSEKNRMSFFAICDSSGHLRYPFIGNPGAIFHTKEHIYDDREGLSLIWANVLITK